MKIVRRFDQGGENMCCSGKKCPAILVTDTGDTFVIGQDVTMSLGQDPEFRGFLGEGETLLRIPKEVLRSATIVM